ncbi:MAG TPA: hypothetical protein VGO14_08350 [Solirubrobacteraceae bacterium]|jgi:hypothetical protein|nr:hypothetical protein [Solirubrobacteraceae bacterium]
MGEVSWSEELRGWLSREQTDFNEALLEGRERHKDVRLALELEIPDIERFVRSEPGRAEVTGGLLDGNGIGDSMEVKWGEFELLGPGTDPADKLHLRMRYRLNLTDTAKKRFRLRGFKLVENDPGWDSWTDTSTLFFRLYENDWWPTSPPSEETSQSEREEAWEEHPGADESLYATGVVVISPRSFARELGSFFGGIRRYSGVRDILRYGQAFGEGLAKTYSGAPVPDGHPSFPVDRPRQPWEVSRRPGPQPGRGGEGQWLDIPERAEAGPDRLALQREVVPFEVGDLSFPLNLHHIRAKDAEASGEPVLLIPGSGVRAELWYGQPVGRTLVDHLLGEGYDVWVETWRASIDLPANSYTLDQAARLDHPAAIETVLDEVRRRTGSEAATLKVVSHCQGSISFVMGAVAGFIPEGRVSHAVSSGISLFFEVPDTTWRKQRMMLPILNLFGTGADAQQGIRWQTPAGRVLAKMASGRMEYPCGNVACQISNFAYGSGWDVLLRHRNLNDEVHQWTSRELGYTPFSLISQVSESCRYGHIVPAKDADLRTPPSYVAAKPKTGTTRFTFIGGDHNWMFEVEGQKKTWEFFEKHKLPADFVMLPGYGHLDTWWGERSPEDVFPVVLDALRWEEGGAPPSSGPGRTQQINRPRRRGLFRRIEKDEPLRTFSPPPLSRRL